MQRDQVERVYNSHGDHTVASACVFYVLSGSHRRGFLRMHAKQVRPEKGQISGGAGWMFAFLCERRRVSGSIGTETLVPKDRDELCFGASWLVFLCMILLFTEMLPRL